MTDLATGAAAYNAAADLIGRNLAAGRAAKTAYVDDRSSLTYGELAERAARAADALMGLGLQPEQRLLMVMLDTVEFPALFLGAILAGIVPVPVNTLLTPDDYAYMLADSRARAVAVSAPLLPQVEAALERMEGPKPRVIVAGEYDGPHARLADLMAGATPLPRAHGASADLPCFWLYSSGSTGRPKGAVHVHGSLVATADCYAGPVLGITETDVVYSAAKLYFAYGLGNALTFPLSVGATTVLMAERPTPEAVSRTLRRYNPTIFYGVPTLYANLLAYPDLPTRDELRLRRCTSAGEPLPEDIGRRWSARFGVDILDGIGSTEMLHIFLSNAPGALRYGTTGKAVPGYELRVVDDDGREVPAGEVGELQVKGPTSAIQYWNNRARSAATFVGAWTRTGDKYRVDEDGFHVYCGRSDDMLKVGGIYVSPAEVEAALIAHEAVLEAAVIGRADEQGLIKPKAFVVTKPGVAPDTVLADALKAHVKDRLAPYKYPRWIEFMDDLPKTATGKIQRFKLRALEADGDAP
jgi:benzoate-CoA ligase